MWLNRLFFGVAVRQNRVLERDIYVASTFYVSDTLKPA